MADTIRVLVVGAAGRMGREVLSAVSETHDIVVAGAVDREAAGRNARELGGDKCPDLTIESKFGATLDACQPDVVIEFTHLSAAAEHAESSLKRKIPIVIGTSGLSGSDVVAIRDSCREFETPAAIIPNFAVGAVLMTHFASLAAKWMPDVEIIERHHRGKLDAPSGTALHTAELIAAARSRNPADPPNAVEKVAGSRGGRHKEVNVHSVRLPGYVASQEVVFGADGELLTLRHDSIDRKCFMPGVILSIRKIREMKGLVIGLDKFMGL